MPDYDSFESLAEQVAKEGRPIRGNGVTYVFIRDESGAELWAQMDGQQQLIGMNPHYHAQTTLPVTLERHISRPENPLDGAFFASAGPEKCSQFVFDLPDARLYGDRDLPQTAQLNLVGFAEVIEENDTEKVDGIYGLDPVQARARVVGRVSASAFRINCRTGRAYLWIEVDLGFGKMEVVSLSSGWKGLPPVHTEISTEVWLSGRIPNVIPAPRPERRLLSRIFSRT